MKGIVGCRVHFQLPTTILPMLVPPTSSCAYFKPTQKPPSFTQAHWSNFFAKPFDFNNNNTKPVSFSATIIVPRKEWSRKYSSSSSRVSMSLRTGIVGLPNVGKSTLFNALVENGKAQAANFPFCTIEPNVGVVGVPDQRLDVLSQLSKSQRTIPASMEFVDIAGLVKGASQGEGLGNKFLSHIREVDSIVQVVRCFEDNDIVHVNGKIDPKSDIEIINLELAFSDLEQKQSRNSSKWQAAYVERLLLVDHGSYTNHKPPLLLFGWPSPFNEESGTYPPCGHNKCCSEVQKYRTSGFYDLHFCNFDQH